MKQKLFRSRKMTMLLVRLLRIILLGIIGYLVYKALLRSVLHGNYLVLSILLLWSLTSYVVIPRLHRFLAKLYLPDYFIGRVRTGDGILGDPVNLAYVGNKQQLINIMEKAGWTLADDLSLKTGWKMVISTALKKSYSNAPVSSLFLFGNQQDVAFQMEVNGNPHARHHVRFWETPKKWWLPGGHKANFLGAASYDRRVGFSLFTGQFTHKIAQDVDTERDFVIKTINKSNGSASTHKVAHFMSGFSHRNGGGDIFITDGALYFIEASNLS